MENQNEQGTTENGADPFEDARQSEGDIIFKAPSLSLGIGEWVTWTGAAGASKSGAICEVVPPGESPRSFPLPGTPREQVSYVVSALEYNRTVYYWPDAWAVSPLKVSPAPALVTADPEDPDEEEDDTDPNDILGDDVPPEPEAEENESPRGDDTADLTLPDRSALVRAFHEVALHFDGIARSLRGAAVKAVTLAPATRKRAPLAKIPPRISQTSRKQATSKRVALPDVVYRALSNANEPLTVRQVAKKTKRDVKRISVALAALLEAKRIRKSGERRGTRYAAR